MNVSTIGIDLAKNTFSLHCVDEHGKPCLRKTVLRKKLLNIMANVPPCLIGMEACSGAHYCNKLDTYPKLATKARFCQARCTATLISRSDIMPKPRKAQVSLEATPYYHCTSRCVRRAFLCGEDTLTGKSFEHRRQWIQDKMLSLSDVFALDICAYAVMSNHYHVVLHVDREQADTWSEKEVIERWHALFAAHRLTKRFLAGESLLKVERNLVAELTALWRTRLMDISWFMRCLNESIARQANEEDNCTGRFYERHPWRSPFGPAWLFQFAPGKSVGGALQVPGSA